MHYILYKYMGFYERRARMAIGPGAVSVSIYLYVFLFCVKVSSPKMLFRIELHAHINTIWLESKL